jgi:hypothetical protein
MYEGLTRRLLGLAIPEGLGLQFVAGFVADRLGSISKQIDCMLVRGNGERIPNTDSYMWPVDDVIAVFEVKKTLKGKELAKAHATLKSVLERFESTHRGFDPERDKGLDRSFALVTGRILQVQRGVTVDRGIFHVIRRDQIAPLRITFAYDGLRSEYDLRRAFSRHLLKLKQKTLLPSEFPNQIICGANSILKLTVEPFLMPMLPDGNWAVFGSSPSNPLELLVFLIMRRLRLFYALPEVKEQALNQPTIKPLVWLKLVTHEDGLLWTHYTNLDMTKEALTVFVDESWSPIELSPNEWGLLRIVQEHALSKSDALLQTWLTKRQANIDNLLAPLLAERLVAIDKNDLIRSIDVYYISVFLGGRTFTAREIDEDKLYRFVERLRLRSEEHYELTLDRYPAALAAFGDWLELLGASKTKGTDEITRVWVS